MLANRRGITVLGTLVVVSIIGVLAAMLAAGGNKIMQRSRVSAAKAQLSGFATALESIAIDTDLYPPVLAHTGQTSAPSGISGSAWHGPYAFGVPANDPWGNSYIYELADNYTSANVFGSFQALRTTGPPNQYSENFSASVGQGTLTVQNDISTNHSSRIKINGVEVVGTSEFNNTNSLITKTVSLQSSNTIDITVASNPGSYFYVTVTKQQLDGRPGYLLRSYGRDEAPGGDGFDADIIFDNVLAAGGSSGGSGGGSGGSGDDDDDDDDD